MRKMISSWSLCAALLLSALGASSAMADVTSGLQSVGQVAGSQQAATSTATSAQDHPSNQNIQVAILSPGAGMGNVTQSNSSSATSAAGNQNGTSQTSTQNGTGGGAQSVLQGAGSSQSASSSATSSQDHPSNENIQVAILSPGAGSGNVSQSNSSSAGSMAGNQNGTGQTATQNAAGTGGAQSAAQEAGNHQSAGSSATSTQDHPSNRNIDVTILGHKMAGSGSVSQSNSSSARSQAGNQNGTTQSATQDAGGGGLVARCVSLCASRSDGPVVQSVGQLAKNEQSANSSATSTQDHPSNVNVPVAILSPGANGGSVSQSNSSSAGSQAGNQNGTTQSATQDAGGGGLVARCVSLCASRSDGPVVQSVGQLAKNEQSANSSATSTQDHPSNVNVPVAILSPGANGGSVSQSNSSLADSKAGNRNGTTQTATQDAAGGPWSTAVQSIGQEAASHQDASSSATSTQAGASNLNLPVTLGIGKGSYGKDGGCCDGPAPAPERVVAMPAPSVSQSNSSSAGSMAGNENGTTQSASQVAGGAAPPVLERCVPSCGAYDSGPVVQSIGQAAYNRQGARSGATSDQWCPANVSFGTLGDLRQSNGSQASSQAGNRNGTTQSGTQNSGSYGLPPYFYPLMV